MVTTQKKISFGGILLQIQISEKEHAENKKENTQRKVFAYFTSNYRKKFRIFFYFKNVLSGRGAFREFR